MSFKKNSFVFFFNQIEGLGLWCTSAMRRRWSGAGGEGGNGGVSRSNGGGQTLAGTTSWLWWCATALYLLATRGAGSALARPQRSAASPARTRTGHVKVDFAQPFIAAIITPVFTIAWAAWRVDAGVRGSRHHEWYGLLEGGVSMAAKSPQPRIRCKFARGRTDSFVQKVRPHHHTQHHTPTQHNTTPNNK